MTTQAQAAATADHSLVVLGVDADGKPHASKFMQSDRDIVLRAAGLMSYRVVQLSSEEIGKLAAPIPDGKVFATGKGFVPFVRRELYDKLAALLGSASELQVPPPIVAAAEQPVDQKQSTSTPAATPKAPASSVGLVTSPWLDVVVGSTVLARDDENESWFEATVVSIAEEDTNVLRLRWRDFPQERQFALHRGRVGIIGPGGK